MKEKLDLHMDPLVKFMAAQPWDSKEFYKEYVAQTYHFVFYSCRMLAMAASLTDLSRDAFYKRAVQHISEESGHEMLALSDLKHLGDTIDQHPELPVTRTMWESQFYKVQRQPTALLGYVLALEYLSIQCRPVFESVMHIYPPNCVNFARVHVSEDPDHVEKAILQIQSLPPQESIEIWRNYEQTCALYRLLVQECALKAAQRLSPGLIQQPARIAG